MKLILKRNYCLKKINDKIKASENNALEPYYLVYVKQNGEILYNYIQSKKILDLYKALCNYKKAPSKDKVEEFNEETKNGSNMKSYANMLEKVVENIDNHIYENYLAYILIDFNINVSKGVTLVKKALVQEPNNLAYIDTLAWGQYKLKNCKEANKQMKRVVDEIGLNDEEIKLHWEKIKECKK